MKFQIGDKVREGSHVGTVTDVGTVLIQVKTSEGTSRVVCPWELVPVRPSRDGMGANLTPAMKHQDPGDRSAKRTRD
jgi:hypothetical protein